jgi:hypothetical protein
VLIAPYAALINNQHSGNKMAVKNKIYFIMMFLVFAGCKKQIHTAVTNTSYNYLVVNGFINSGDTTTINLSRTVKVSDTVNYVPELNATVSIEGSQGGNYNLVSAGNGNYKSAALTLSGTQNYRLKIITSNGKQYLSDYVPLKNSPPIDSVYYTATATGAQVFLNAHDAAGATHYYKWDYNETYIVQSQFESKYIVVNQDTIAPRTPAQQIYHCWVTDSSSTIVLGSSAKLSQDVITSQNIATIPSISEKLFIKYSILVKQHALTSDAFNYFEQLKSNTEQIGSIFDAQPSALTGNVHNINNPGEVVIGYVTAGAVTTKRIFINSNDLPAYNPVITYYNGCEAVKLLYDYTTANTDYHANQVRAIIYTGQLTPIDTVVNFVTGFTAASPHCVDCTLRGTNKQPLFWK